MFTGISILSFGLNYLITILHELLPLPPELEEDLVVQLVSNLCQSKIRSNEIDDENGRNHKGLKILSSKVYQIVCQEGMTTYN